MDKAAERAKRGRVLVRVMKAARALIRCLPLGAVSAIGFVAGCLFYICSSSQRRLARQTMAAAFPDISRRERAGIARSFFINMPRGALETMWFSSHLSSLGNVTVEGISHLDAALAQGRGVMAISAHFGNFPLLHLKLAQTGYPIYVMSRPMRDPAVGKYLNDLQSRCGIETIHSFPRKRAISETLAHLRGNHIVLIQMDQDFGDEGIMVDFFGRPASTPTGPVVLASRAGSPMVPMFIFRTGAGRHCVKILPAHEMVILGDQEATVKANVQALTGIIEEQIRRAPQEWAWIHRRWKSGQEPEKADKKIS
ncbi:MAG: lysophospholipid acyltransferase family protein [Candidatus Omnitrophota bacterium]|nr:lysophospholipid acyltransferase family protein [Candidatus Omnitrophota bacterium]MDZ4242210.1 lysophospholipid acyltransferase family protein [Candidatus Omnitrophota bacterium]